MLRHRSEASQSDSPLDGRSYGRRKNRCRRECQDSGRNKQALDTHFFSPLFGMWRDARYLSWKQRIAGSLEIAFTSPGV